MKKLCTLLVGLSLALFGLQAQNNALNFDGNDDYVALGTIPQTVDFSTGFSFVGWVKYDAFNSWSRIFDFGNGSTSNNILLANNGDSNTLEFHVYNGSTSNNLSVSTTIATGVWVHVAATIGSTGVAKIYVNGLSVGTNQLITPPKVDRTNCYLGRSNWNGDGYFKGTMDNVSIWTKELSQADIINLMNSTVVGTETSLFAAYNFNQGTANATNTVNTLTDVTATPKNGTLTNFALTGTTSNWVTGFDVAQITKVLTVSANTASLTTANSNATTINVASNITWTAVSSATWLTVTPTLATTGSATLNISATAIAVGATDKTATITLSAAGVANQVITVTQSNPFPTAQTVIWENSITVKGTHFLGVNSGKQLGQQFLVTSPNTSIQEITLHLRRESSVATNCIISLYNDNGSNQMWIKIADIASVSNSTLSDFISPVTINSTNCLNSILPLTLNAGNKYWIVLTTSNSEAIWWNYDNSNSAINGTGASKNNFATPEYNTNYPFFMKITASDPLVTALDKTTSDEVLVEASAKNISINSAFENYSIELFNVAGKKMLSQSVTQSGSTTIVADVTSGIYFVKVSAEGRYFTKKVFLH